MRVLLLLVVGGCTRPIDLGAPDSASICPAGDCVPDPPAEQARVGWAQVATDPEGGAWVLWASADGPAVTGLWLAHSPAAGEPLGAPIEVPVAEPPNVGVAEKPSLAVDGDRVAVAYTGSGVFRHGDAQVLYVQIGTREGTDVRFGEARAIDSLHGDVPWSNADPDELVVEQARVAFAPDGELWALWKRQVYGTVDRATWARESADFAPMELSASLSHDHDCSPPDFRFGFSGTPLIGLRSNLDGWLQTVVVTADSEGVPTAIAQVSDDRWRYSTEVCPEDGPRHVELADGTRFAAWMGPADTAWRLFSAWSTDAGVTWTAPAWDHDGVELGEKWVSVVPTPEGPFYTAVEGLDSRTRVLLRDVPGGPSTEAWLTGGDGSDLGEVELAHAAGRTVAVGLGEGRVIWLLDL